MLNLIYSSHAILHQLKESFRQNLAFNVKIFKGFDRLVQIAMVSWLGSGGDIGAITTIVQPLEQCEASCKEWVSVLA